MSAPLNLSNAEQRDLTNRSDVKRMSQRSFPEVKLRFKFGGQLGYILALK